MPHDANDPPSDAERFDALDRQAASRPNHPIGPVLPCARERKARVRIVLLDPSFGVEQALRYRLRVGSESFEGTTGIDGIVDHLVPESASEGELVVWPAREGARAMAWTLELGELLPVEVDDGVASRLDNLVLPDESSPDQPLPESAAVETFQGAFGLEASGEVDPSTRDRVDRVYRSSEPLDRQEPWTPGPYRAFRSPFE